jgi:hypothetical protein
LFLPIFALPFVAVYGPLQSFDSLILCLGGYAGEEAEKKRAFHVDDRVEVSSGEEPWKLGSVVAVGDGLPKVKLDDSSAVVEWAYVRPQSAKETTELRVKFEEVVFSTSMSSNILACILTYTFVC